MLIYLQLDPPPKKCVITGEHAKYTDPLTKLPYSSLQAFQQLRKSLVLEPQINKISSPVVLMGFF